MNIINLKRQTLLVTFLCYLPHIVTEPFWIFILFLVGIAYRLIADYFSYPPIPRWIRFFLLIGCLVLLLGSVSSSGFLIRCLLVFIILKCLEIHTVRDLKVIIFCNFFLIVSALLVIKELWIILYLLVAIFANLAIMLKLSASEVSLKQMTGKSSKQLLIAIPLSILLFFIFPRIEPFWHVPSLSKGNIGFNETMSPGSIAELYNDDSIAMQITFKNNPILAGYWRGIILTFYNGEIWAPSHDNHFSPLPALALNEKADYEIILEPNQKRWLFYTNYPVAGGANLSFAPDQGLIRQNNEAITQSFAYSIKVQATPYHNLNVSEYTDAIELPKGINPRLHTWALKEFADNHKDIKTFINFLRNYISQQPFWYTLSPPQTVGINQMDTFWFDTQKGFCEHYASAITFILRTVGIPARVVVGYQGGQWNPYSHALTLRQNNAHAWLEYWQANKGWQQLDPTSFIAPERIDPTIRNQEMNLLNHDNYYSLTDWILPQKFKYFFQSIRFFSERWFLLYNQNAQKNLMQRIGLGNWDEGQLLQASLGLVILFFVLVGIYYQWMQKQSLDSLLREYHLLQKEFRKFNVATLPSSTLEQQCKSLSEIAPAYHSELALFMDKYEQLRLKQSDHLINKKETIALFKTLRLALRKEKVTT